ncbi:MAG TPA: tRNA dimethylallyltransferase, partial [Propionibacteriaceae bacterium]|nr:tRNA dimethylallyltransferase [Propionibacteriaceae bacterium]
TRAIVDQVSFPGTDAVVRARWQARLEEVGAESLHAELAHLAPDTASGILPGNARRVVRALEVIELTGGYTPQLPAWTYAVENVHQFGLQLPRDVMDARIEARVHEMWASGLVEEVRHLETLGLRQGLTAARALGYRQVLAMLDGLMTEAEAQQATIAGTRRFARKQLGWYARDDRITWLDAGDAGNVARILDRIAEASTEMTTSVEG